MTKCNNTILTEHAQNFIRDVMADRLRKAGFISQNRKDIHWYRVVGGNVLQAIIFYSQWSALPMFLGIGYSCHPLFLTPEYHSGIRLVNSANARRSFEVFNSGRMVLKDYNNACFSPEIAVMCPQDEYHGADILEEILSRLDAVRTPEQCYTFHKHRFSIVAEQLEASIERLYENISVDFMDEVIFNDDQEMIPYCKARIIHLEELYERIPKIRKLWKSELYDINALEHLRPAVFENKQEEHLEYLHAKEQANILELKRKIRGIPGL